MPTSKDEVQPAWDKFQADMKSLRDELRRHYEPASTQDPDLQTALNKLGKAADEVFEALGRATRDPDVRQGTRQAARSFGSALAETFKDVADELAAAMRKKDSGPPP
jgi:hypothetical protein